MQLLHDIFISDAAVRLGWTLMHMMWVGFAVAAAFAGVALALRRRSANARYLAGCVALKRLEERAAARPIPRQALEEAARRLAGNLPAGWRLTESGRCDAPRKWSGKTDCTYLCFAHETLRMDGFPQVTLALWLAPRNYVGRRLPSRDAQPGGAWLHGQSRDHLLFLETAPLPAPHRAALGTAFQKCGFARLDRTEATPAAVRRDQDVAEAPRIVWGKPTDGVVCGVALDRERYVLGQDVQIGVYLRNTLGRELTCHVGGITSSQRIGDVEHMALMVKADGGKVPDGIERRIPAGAIRRIFVGKLPTRPLLNYDSSLHFIPAKTPVVIVCTPMFRPKVPPLAAQPDRTRSGLVVVEVLDPKKGAAASQPATGPGNADSRAGWFEGVSKPVNGLQCRLIVLRNRPTKIWKKINGVMTPVTVLRDHPALELHNTSDKPIYIPLWRGELPILGISITGHPDLRSPTDYGEAWATPRLLKPGEVLRRQLSGNASGNYSIAYGHWRPGAGWVPFDPAGKTYEVSAVMRWDREELAQKHNDPATKVKVWTGCLAAGSVKVRLGARPRPAAQPATRPAEEPPVLASLLAAGGRRSGRNWPARESSDGTSGSNPRRSRSPPTF